MKTPAHPGGFVKSEVIEALGLAGTDGDARGQGPGGNAGGVVGGSQ